VPQRVRGAVRWCTSAEALAAAELPAGTERTVWRARCSYMQGIVLDLAGIVLCCGFGGCLAITKRSAAAAAAAAAPQRGCLAHNLDCGWLRDWPTKWSGLPAVAAGVGDAGATGEYSMYVCPQFTTRNGIRLHHWV